MTCFSRRLLLPAVCLAFIGVSVPAQRSSAEGEVWRLEEKYWQLVQAYDLQGYRALWHEDFVGWPDVEPTPVGKAKISGWLERHKNAGQRLSYELRREAVRQFGDVVVTHYVVNAKWTGRDGKVEADGSRITHTWMKTGDGWKIITGMSGDLPRATP